MPRENNTEPEQAVDAIDIGSETGTLPEGPTRKRAGTRGRTHISQRKGSVSAEARWGREPARKKTLRSEELMRFDDAVRILYVQDEDGNVAGDSMVYQAYLENARSYAKARADYSREEAKALSDPTTAAMWAMESQFYRQLVTHSWTRWRTKWAQKIEKAIDTVRSGPE